jgi:alpha/beta superfamily hydrolase
VGIAPYLPLAPAPAELSGIRSGLLIIGTRDQIVSPTEVETFGAQIDATVVQLETDHFFVLKQDLVADVILRWIGLSTDR